LRSYPTTRFKNLCIDGGQYGLNVAADQYRDSGVRLLRTSDLETGGFVAELGVFIDGPCDNRFLVEAGDVLLTRSGSVGQSFQVPEALAGASFAGFLIRYRAHPTSTDARYLFYVTQSQGFQSAVQADAVSSTISNFNAERYSGITVPLPPVEEQRRIADFLDDQVAGIHDLLDSRRSQRNLVDERYLSSWSDAVDRVNQQTGIVSLRRGLSSIVDGPFGSSLTSSHYSDEGTRVIRLGNIGRNEFLDDDKAYIPHDYAVSLGQHAVLPGDLLVAGLGDSSHPLGRAAVAQDWLGPAIVKADCYRLRLTPDLRSDYVAWYLSAPSTAARVALLSRGSTRARLNTDVVRDVPIAMASLTAQVEAVRAWDESKRDRDAANTALTSSVEALEERKRCLITAAVTGELDVTTAKPIGMRKWVPNVGAGVETPAAAQASSIGGIG
jgi:type I restriction enzyme S subunit